MNKEGVPLQIDLFTGALADTRTSTQKRIDRDREKPQQTELFSQREVAQFGVRARPLLPLSPHTKLVLFCEDPRTEEEIERDQMREAERLTAQLFPENVPVAELKPDEETTNISVVVSAISRPTPILGFRAFHRRMNTPVRTRAGR